MGTKKKRKPEGGPPQCVEAQRTYSKDDVIDEPVAAANTVSWSAWQSTSRGNVKRRKTKSVRDLVTVAEAMESPSEVTLSITAQHEMLVHLQKLLEKMCLAFGAKWCAEAMRARQWLEHNSLEITSWIKIIHSHPQLIPSGALAREHVPDMKALCESVASIRHHAVHRKPVPHSMLLDFYKSATSFAELHRDQDTTLTIIRYRQQISEVLDDLLSQQIQLKASLELQTLEIEAQALVCARDAMYRNTESKGVLQAQIHERISAVFSNKGHSDTPIANETALGQRSDLSRQAGLQDAAIDVLSCLDKISCLNAKTRRYFLKR